MRCRAVESDDLIGWTRFRLHPKCIVGVVVISNAQPRSASSAVLCKCNESKEHFSNRYDKIKFTALEFLIIDYYNFTLSRNQMKNLTQECNCVP